MAETVLASGGEHDRERAFRALHPDMTLVSIEDWPDGGEFFGREDSWAFVSSFVETFEGGAFELVDPLAAGDQLVAGIWRAGTGEGSGVAIDFKAEMLWTFRDGLVFRQEYFWTREEALAAMEAT